MNTRLIPVALWLGLFIAAPHVAHTDDAPAAADSIAAPADTTIAAATIAPDSLAATTTPDTTVAAASDTALATAADTTTAVAAARDSAAAPKPRGILVSAEHPLVLPGLDSDGAPATAARSGSRMRDTVTVIHGVTVQGARKGIESRSSVTATRLDRAAIARFMPNTAADAMVSAPGVEVIKTGPWASKVSFRGFEGERVLVMVDGVRLNTGRGHGSNASLVAVDRLDGVDLVAGANGAAFGSDAIGGVVNLVTHRPLFAPRPALSVLASVRGTEPGDEFAQSARLKFMSKHVGAELDAGGGHLNELVTATGHVPNSGSHDADLGARVALLAGPVTLDVEHTRHASRDVGLPALAGRYPLISRDADRVELSAPFTVGALGRELPVRAQLLASDQRYRTDFDETVLDTVVSSRTHRPIAYHATVAEDRVTTRSRGVLPEIRFGGERAELRLSGELRRETTNGPKTVTVTTTAAGDGQVTDVARSTGENVPDARRDVRAGAAALRWSAGPLRVESGARYDWVLSRADSTASSWSPALDVRDRRWSFDGGLAWHWRSIEPYGRVASGFRTPNLEERYYRGPIHGAMDVFGNPGLVPETNVTYEAGVRADADGWGSLRVSAYRTESRDFITLKYLLLVYGRPRFEYANVGRVQIDGLELTARARLRSVQTQWSATLPRGRDLATGRRLTDVGTPRMTADVAFPVGRWLPSGMLSLRARWNDAVVADRIDASSLALARRAFWTASAELGTTVAGTRIAVAVKNVFDDSYREPMSFIDEPGRAFSFSLKREFQVPLPAAKESHR